MKDNPVISAYPNGECPDCGEDIPKLTKNGEECKNCGHVFCEETADDDVKFPRPVLKNDVLYIGDNGRCFCGEHAGCSARYSGRDISGQLVMGLTPKQAKDNDLSCERCGHKG